MIASLDELYHSELFFLPVMDENARLVGLEIIATFAAEDGAVRMPTELVAPSFRWRNNTVCLLKNWRC